MRINKHGGLVGVGVLLSALMLSGCLSQKPDAVKKIETVLGDENSVVNSAPAEGAKDVVQNGATEVLGPGGEVVNAGAAVLGASVSAATIAVRQQADRADYEATVHSEQVYQDRADYFNAKYDCLVNKNCVEWQKWQKKGLPPLPTAKKEKGHEGGGD